MMETKTDDQPDEYHGVGGSYVFDHETKQRRPYSGREHLLIKPARPPEPKPEAETMPAPQPEKTAPPSRKQKSKRGDK